MGLFSTQFNSRPPALLIGAGISRRFLENYPSWEELLKDTSQRIGIGDRQFTAYKQSAKQNNQFGVLPQLATDLEKYLLDSLKNGSINPINLFSEANELKMYDQEVNPFKILIASRLSQYRIIQDSNRVEELNSFKKLINTTPAVITTNYDSFLEKSIFSRYCVYSQIEDYYFSDSEGIGEIYKVHGTVEMPDSIIVDNDDFSNYLNNSKIVTSKILSLLCDYPLLILGYSLDDFDVKQIITDLISSLGDEKLKEVEQNILFVAYEPNEMDLRESLRTFDLNNRKITLRTIQTDNFKAIFDELIKIVPSATSSQVRRFRQLVKRIVITTNPDEQQLLYVGAVDFENKDLKDVVLFATDKYQATGIASKFISCDDIIRDILFNDISLDPHNVLSAFEVPKLFQTSEYVPLYPYYSKQNELVMGPRLKKFFLQKQKQFSIENLKKEWKSLDINSLSDLDKLRPYRIPMALTYLVIEKKLGYDEALAELKSRYTQLISDSNSKTKLKMAVCFIMSKIYPVDL